MFDLVPCSRPESGEVAGKAVKADAVKAVKAEGAEVAGKADWDPAAVAAAAGLVCTRDRARLRTKQKLGLEHFQCAPGGSKSLAKSNTWAWVYNQNFLLIHLTKSWCDFCSNLLDLFYKKHAEQNNLYFSYSYWKSLQAEAQNLTFLP